VKRILILSEEKSFKKDLVQKLVEEKGDQIAYTTVSDRSNAITELTSKEFDGILIHCKLEFSDLRIILKYLSTNDYYLSHIFFLSEDFALFKNILEELHFPNIYLISLPINLNDLTQKVFSTLYPSIIKKIDKVYKLDIDFLKAFINSTKRVLTDFCGLTEVKLNKPYILDKNNPVTFSVQGMIPLESDVFIGKFIIGFTKDVYLKLINKVLMIEATEIDKDSLDFSAELVNMTYGQAKFILNDSGYDFQKVIPTHELNPAPINNGHHVVVVPIETEIGVIHLEVEVVKIPGFVL
jgi:CheY-specific phosphatase CheX